MSIVNEAKTTFGFLEIILEVQNTSMGVIKVENTLMNLNRVQLLIRDKVKTTSGFSPIEVRTVKNA